MLDEFTYIPRLRLALFDLEVVYDRRGYNLERIRRLIYGMSSNWHLSLVTGPKNHLFSNQIGDKLRNLGLNVEELMLIDASYPEAKLRDRVLGADLVYAPVLKTLPVKFFQPRFREPYDADQAVDVLVYFASAIEDFNYASYYEFLRRTGPTMNQNQMTITTI